MPSGAIEKYATVVALVKDQESIRFTLKCSFADELKIGRNISHSGAYLTVVSVTEDIYIVIAMEETLDRSNLRLLKVGEKVNVEHSMVTNGRLDGHIVQRRVGQAAECIGIRDVDESWYFTFKYTFDKEMAKRGHVIVDKESVVVNGVSLMVCNSTDDIFRVAIIPHACGHTSSHISEVGSIVNLRFDIIGKYISRVIQYK